MQHEPMNTRRMAVSATLHCLTGCAIGEVLGLIIGTALGWHGATTITLSIGLAFLFGYSLSLRPLVQSGLALKTAMATVLAADTLSIFTMEVADNTVMAIVPGAMGKGLDEVLFWLTMVASLAVAFVAAYPVNLYLLKRGKGHALTHQYHGHH